MKDSDLMKGDCITLAHIARKGHKANQFLTSKMFADRVLRSLHAAVRELDKRKQVERKSHGD